MTYKLEGDYINENHNNNLIINGDFQVWQRNTTFTVPTPYTPIFTADRWYFSIQGSVTNPAVITREPWNSSDNIGVNPDYFLRLDTNPTGVSIPTLEQFIDDKNIMAGKTLTLSCWVRVQNLQPNSFFRSVFVKWYGNGGSPGEAVSYQVFDISSSWKKLVHTFTIPTNEGKTLTNTGRRCLSIRLEGPFYNSGNTQYPLILDVANVKLEYGTEATQFYQKQYSEELQDCQYYFKQKNILVQKIMNNTIHGGGPKYYFTNTGENMRYPFRRAYIQAYNQQLGAVDFYPYSGGGPQYLTDKHTLVLNNNRVEIGMNPSSIIAQGDRYYTVLNIDAEMD